MMPFVNMTPKEHLKINGWQTSKPYLPICNIMNKLLNIYFQAKSE